MAGRENARFSIFLIKLKNIVRTIHIGTAALCTGNRIKRGNIKSYLVGLKLFARSKSNSSLTGLALDPVIFAHENSLCGLVAPRFNLSVQVH